MSLTQETRVEKIEVVNTPDGYPIVRVRSALVVSDGGVEIASRPHRHMLMPDADLSSESADVVAIATAVFTDSVKAAFKAASQAK